MDENTVNKFKAKQDEMIMEEINRQPEFEITTDPSVKTKILESVSKVVEKNKKKKKCKINKLHFWCTACTHTYEINLKDENGKLKEQQICPHMTFKSFEMI